MFDCCLNIVFDELRSPTFAEAQAAAEASAALSRGSLGSTARARSAMPALAPLLAALRRAATTSSSSSPRPGCGPGRARPRAASLPKAPRAEETRLAARQTPRGAAAIRQPLPDASDEPRRGAPADSTPPGRRSQAATSGRGDDTAGNPRRAQIYQFELFALILLSIDIKQTIVYRAIRADSIQSTVSSPLSDTSRLSQTL